MNCISGSMLLTCLTMIACTACEAPAAGTDAGTTSPDYAVLYTIAPDPGSTAVAVGMDVEQTRGQLRELSFEFDASKISQFEADGMLDVRDNTVYWQPDTTGGKLRWHVRPSNKRNDGGYDALLNKQWGIFRAEDIIPRARARTLKDANSITRMRFDLPSGWSAISEYSSINDPMEVVIPARRFDQPQGWIAVGELGVRRETIAGTRITVAAPQGQAVRRMDMLALLNWTLPELISVLPDALSRLTIISAGDPMWRGGLSAPSSIFIHADRPLISENATSTLVHEVVHVAFDIKAAEGFDWIVEGLAEYYSLELLQRGGAITTRRYNRALESQEQWALESGTLCGVDSSGATTALSVTIFRDLDREIRSKSKGSFSLDNLVARLSGSGTETALAELRAAAAELLGESPATLRDDNLPGCQKFALLPEA